MKILKNLPLIGFSTVFVSCGTFENLNKPISDTGFSPLDRPGMYVKAASESESLVNLNEYGFNNGEIVEVVISNTAFYDKVPKAGDQYIKILTVGDVLSVIGGEKDYIKVLTEKGETGYVSSVMVVTKGSLTDAGDIEPNVTVVGANETPIVPEIAPDPESDVEEAPESDPTPSDIEPAIEPSEAADKDTELPDPKPVEPSLPKNPELEPAVPEKSE